MRYEVMLSIKHLPITRPTIDPYSPSGFSGSASLDSASRNSLRTATQASPAASQPRNIGNTADPEAVLGMLKDLFMQFFNQLQGILDKGVRPPVPKNNDLPIPQPRVKPADDATLTDKRNEYIPGLSNKRKGEKPNNIWTGFRQGSNGNCVTISAIKAAMAKFGQSPKDIYKSVEASEQGYKVVMRDGFELTLSKAELQAAIRGSNFVGMSDPEMLKDAHFLFACSAKRAQMENNDGWASRSFNAAITTLNNGEDEDRNKPGEGFLRLGLKDHMKRVKVSEFADPSLIGMVNRRGHSVAVVEGCEELYGRKGDRPRDGQAVALI